MENKRKRGGSLNLFPRKFKIIGAVILIVCLLTALLNKYFTLFIDKEIFYSILKSIVLLSLLMIALSREKVEDELMDKIRLATFTQSFISGVFIVIIAPIFYNIFERTDSSTMSAVQILSIILLMYIMLFRINIKSLNEK